MRLTRHRAHILKMLVEYCYLSTQEFYRLIENESPTQDSHERKVRRLLKDFSTHLKSAPLIDYDNSHRFLTYRNIYWLSSKGLALAQTEGIDNGEGKANDEHSPRTLEHEYDITRFHLRIKEFAKQHELDLYWQQRDLKKAINPDALFGLSQDENAYYYFLEIEKSKAGNYINGEPQILRKLSRYYEYYNSDACAKDWGDFRKFRVVVIVQTEARQKNLLTHLSERHKHPMFWIANQENPLTFLTPKDSAEMSYSLLHPFADMVR
jgi:Replication-relaxation